MSELLDDFLSELSYGWHDDMLDVIQELIDDRRKELDPPLTQENVSLHETLKFKGNINPHYLRGKRVKVLKTNPKTATVKVVDPVPSGAKLSGDRKIRAPYPMMERE